MATVLRALSKFMPNLRGPGERRRRLYANVMTSVVMYAAPVWAGGFASAPDAVTRPWRRLQRAIAIRVIAAYRTVSYDAATLLARMPPWPLEAALRRRVFERLTELKTVATLVEKRTRRSGTGRGFCSLDSGKLT
ncbi:reverse transcriptase [Lasius niger]|uniref:Reverse transcriptase n=1 Tax=Lasius niger TaxID=67767 RepID=A0A0J7NEY3_LASNI|nr:reverse transcriptase [Lasius niger]